MPEVRTRFAPSPTGYMHIGGMRTALFNWLWARHTGGKFILRIDDTDRQRNLDEAIRPILAAFCWLDLAWDEGPEVGGPRGPYFQSQRGEIYQRAAEKLVAEKKAYRDFETPEEVQRQREAADREKRPFISSRKSLELSEAEVQKLVAEGRPHVIRFLVPRGTTVALDDVVRGHVEWDASLIADPVIMRGDSTPLYNFATVVDDAAMEITHVIRAEEHLSNTPPQILMHHALGHALPVFAHIPFVTAPGTTKKLSKREIKKYRENPKFRKMFDDADRVFPQIGLGSSETLNPVMVEYYEKIGFLPHAVFNSLARLGWSLDDRTEFMTRETIIENFTLERIVKSPAGLDPDKLYSFQTHWMGQLPLEEKVDGVIPYLVRANLIPSEPSKTDRHYIADVVSITGERLRVFSDILDVDFFFRRDEDVRYDPQAESKRLGNPKSIDVLRTFRLRYARSRTWNRYLVQNVFHELVQTVASPALSPSVATQLADVLQDDAARRATQNSLSNPKLEEAVVSAFVESENIKIGDVIHAIRVAITGKANGPGLYDCIAVLGRERCLHRISLTLDRLAPSKIETELDAAFTLQPRPIPAPLQLPKEHDELELFDGAGILTFGTRTLRGQVKMLFKWTPSPAVRFEFSTESVKTLLPDIPFGAARLEIPNWNSVADVVVTWSSFLTRPPILRGVLNGRLLRGVGASVSRARFQLINFHEFRGEPLSDGSRLWVGRAVLHAWPWRVTIDSIPDSDADPDTGYSVTHTGQIELEDGRPFGTAPLDEMLMALQHFLSFVRGFWVAPLLPVGFEASDRPVWWEYGNRKQDRAQSVRSWFPLHDQGALEQAFVAFLDRWRNTDLRPFLRAAIYWYLDANAPIGATESRIMSSLVAMEATHTLTQWLDEHDPADSADGSEITRLEQLLELIRVSPAIPEEFRDLAEFANFCGAKSSVQALVLLRNAIAHPTSAGLSLLDSTRNSGNKYWQAWFLSQWYVELGLLWAIGYRGKYLPRIGTGRFTSDSEAVPWSDPVAPTVRTDRSDTSQ